MSYLSTMSHPQLSSFDPFAPHPFTSGGTSLEQSPTLRGQDMPPTLEVRSPSQSPVSTPMDMPAVPLHAPKPTVKIPTRVFEQYDRGRITPDLVVRRQINAWTVQPSFR
ncbi:hypothetical protein B0J17DRAFT_341001 [Rhizoctonia solani]|nr:hypothetical protein B0J17DRAFT_341001 [Rhizoctonia solani]